MVKEGLLPAGARFDRALLAGHLALKKGDRKEAEVQLALVQDHAREIQVLERDLALEVRTKRRGRNRDRHSLHEPLRQVREVLP